MYVMNRLVSLEFVKEIGDSLRRSSIELRGSHIYFVPYDCKSAKPLEDDTSTHQMVSQRPVFESAGPRS